MKLEFFQTFTYYGPDHGSSWPAPPRCYDSEWGRATVNYGLDQCSAALDAGFDSLNFAEHHYSPKQLTPNPIPMAAIAGKRFPDANIGVFGTDIPINNPVRIAEEYAMLDNLLDGRLRIGMLRGTPNEYLTYGTNPWESRDRFEEATLLVKHCFNEPEPFGWEGRYYRYRQVAVWPHPVQEGGPRILVSGNSKNGAVFAGRHGLDLGFSYLAPHVAAVNLAAYYEAAAAAGWTPTNRNVTYRQFMYVAESDADAQDVVAQYAGGGLHALFAGASPETMMVMMQIGAAMAGVPKHVVLDPANAKPFTVWPALVGTPDTVLARIADARASLDFGRLEVSIGVGVNPVPHDVAMASIKLIADQVAPALHAETF